MNYKHFLLIGVVFLIVGVLIPFQIYNIRKRRHTEQILSHDNHNHDDGCCCH